MKSPDPTLLTDLLTAGLQPELVARVANACAASYALGLIDGQPQRSAGAVRQARYRERHSVTDASQSVTNRNEASQRDNSLSPTPPIPKSINKNLSMRGKRGTRIPDDWRLTDEHLAAAKAEGLTDLDIQREAARFSDYWKAKSGSSAVKLDWMATWRNWCRTAAEKLGRPRPTTASAGNPQVFVSGDHPAFAAWEKFHGKKHPKNRNGGWHFDTLWPPGFEPKEAVNG